MEQIFSVLGNEFFEFESFIRLASRFALNLLVMYVVIDRIYYKINQRKEYLFTFFIINILIFFVSSLLSDVKMKTGFAFGLFAIFSILRYRTEQINIKEMTFLFSCIILAVLNSMVTIKVPFANILFANLVITGAIYLLEKAWLKTSSRIITITYEHIDLVHEESKEALIGDLRQRTGFTITRFEINSINFLNDSASITLFCE